MAGKAGAVGQVPTMAEWLETHIADLTGVTDRTRADYRAHVVRHIAPTLGSLDVDEVTTSDISRWANALEQEVSAKTVANLRGLLSRRSATRSNRATGRTTRCADCTAAAPASMSAPRWCA